MSEPLLRGPDLTALHFAPAGATRRPSRDHLTTLEFLGQGAAQRSGSRYEPLPRWGNPRRAVVAGLLAAALLGAVVHGGLASTARGADPPVSEEVPREVFRDEGAHSSRGDGHRSSLQPPGYAPTSLPPLVSGSLFVGGDYLLVHPSAGGPAPR